MAKPRITRVLAYSWVVVLSLALLGPVLAPGFVLSYDLVFTPRQDLLPGSIGLGTGLPRAVPQDAVVAIVETLVPGALLEKLVLLAIPIVAGTGMLRLLPTTGPGVIAATLAIVNPYVAQRLVIGHWGFLLAYALVPWVLAWGRDVRSSGDTWAGLRLLLVAAAGSLTPSGSLLMAAMVVPAVLPGSRLGVSRRLALLAAVAATWLPWLVPALLHPMGTAGDADGAFVFGLRPDAPGGALASAVVGGGIWNADAVLPLRATWLSIALAVMLLGLGAWGARPLAGSLGRAITAWWVLIAGTGLVAALASALAPGPWSSLLESVPGGGLARDAHKLLAPWVLLLAAAAGVGAGRLIASTRDRATQAAVAGACLLVPLACQVDMLGGAGGRLTAVDYPPAWSTVREALQAESTPGDVVSFPWTAFRRFDWNDGRTVLDPAPRWLPRTTVTSDSLVVRTPDGDVVVDGDDPRAREISRSIAAGDRLAERLPELGVGWALVAAGTPGPVPELRGWRRVVDAPGLTLYAAPAGSVEEAEVDVRLVAGVDLVVGLGLLGGLLALGLRRIRRVRARAGGPLIP